MFDTILNDQGNTAVPVSTITEIVQEENEDYFFSLFNANADSSSSKGTSVERKQKALIIKRRKFQGGLHPGLIHGKSLYFFLYSFVYRSSSTASRHEELDIEADRLIQGMDKSLNDSVQDLASLGTSVSQQLGVFHNVDDQVYQSEFEGDLMLSQPIPTGNFISTVFYYFYFFILFLFL